MRVNRCVVFLLCSLTLFAFGCQKDANTSVSSAATTSTPGAANSSPPATVTATPATSKPSDAACAFVTKEEIKAVQKEDVKGAKGTERADNGMIIAQCFYTLNNFANSVSLQVTRTDPNISAKRDPKDFWEETFSKYEGEEGEKEREREKEKEREREREREKNKEAQKGAERRGESEEEEEGAPPKKINGIGDEAFWTGNRVGGALYVLKKNSFIRISIGGTGDEATKINKSKALAKKALARL
ncbi:MAG: hypothetical protein WBP93_14335 [Pyrinomonadaceae bacterium]